MATSTVYGPVPSWRLGRSLGIDPLLPPKTCTFDCIYCQLGKTVNKIPNPERLKATLNVDKVTEDLETVLLRIASESIDYVTFSGTGEPTLNLQLGEMITRVKDMIGKLPVAVLTNASLLNREDVRTNLAKADLIIAKLDAPNQKLFETINRPAEGLRLDLIVEGLEALRQEAPSEITLQIMLLESNDGAKYNTQPVDLEAMTELIEEIRPHEVEVNTPTRPPSEPFVRAVPPERLENIARRFEKMLRRVKVVSRTRPTTIKWVNRKHEALEIEIANLLARRPCTVEDLMKATGTKAEEVEIQLRWLMERGLVGSTRFRGRVYYEVIQSSFVL